MKDDTPYRERPKAEIAHEQRCMRAIFAKALPVSFIFEAFGGIGNTAAVMAESFPDVHIMSADLDAECTNIYNRRLAGTNAVCFRSDALQLFNSISPKINQGWGASLDFNRFTIMDVFGRREGEWKTNLIENVIERNPKWVQLTDSAVRYLHFNHERYGCSRDPEHYIQTLGDALYERWGLSLAAHARFHAASYLLLTPN